MGGMGRTGYAIVVVDDTVAARVAGDLAGTEDPGAFPGAVTERLLAAQLEDLAAGDDTVVTDDEVVLPWAVFSRWTVDRRDAGWGITITRPGVRSTLAWSPELGEPGPDTDALAELRDALAQVHPALAGCPLELT